MNLNDVFAAFVHSKLKLKTVQCYEFGSVVSDDGIPCYKIGEGGKITVYLVVVDKRTKKDMVYESNLALEKSIDMLEIEIRSIKK